MAKPRLATDPVRIATAHRRTERVWKDNLRRCDFANLPPTGCPSRFLARAPSPITQLVWLKVTCPKNGSISSFCLSSRDRSTQLSAPAANTKNCFHGPECVRTCWKALAPDRCDPLPRHPDHRRDSAAQFAEDAWHSAVATFLPGFAYGPSGACCGNWYQQGSQPVHQ